MKITTYQDNSFLRLPSDFKLNKDPKSLKSRKVLAEVLEKNAIDIDSYTDELKIKELMSACTDNEDYIILKPKVNSKNFKAYIIVFKDTEIDLSIQPCYYVINVDENRTFTVNEYDGCEYIDYLDAHEWYNTKDLEF